MRFDIYCVKFVVCKAVCIYLVLYKVHKLTVMGSRVNFDCKNGRILFSLCLRVSFLSVVEPCQLFISFCKLSKFKYLFTRGVVSHIEGI
jgi:hypothetical protein